VGAGVVGPEERHRDVEAPTGLEHAAEVPENSIDVRHVFEDHLAENAVDARGSEGEGGQVGLHGDPGEWRPIDS